MDYWPALVSPSPERLEAYINEWFFGPDFDWLGLNRRKFLNH